MQDWVNLWLRMGVVWASVCVVVGEGVPVCVGVCVWGGGC